MKEVIRLTNKTAIALRKSAVKLRSMYLALGVALTAGLAVLGVYLGFTWMPAVPIMIVLIAAVDYLLIVKSRSDYLLLIGQAICTEAAARDIKDGSAINKRRDQALADLMNVKKDAMQAGRRNPRAGGAKPFFEREEESDLDEEADDYLPPREDEEDDDMRPVVKKAQQEPAKKAAGETAAAPSRRRRAQHADQNTLLFIKNNR